MPRWTDRQDDLIRQNAHLGADALAKLIHKETGVIRTPEATKRRAYRIGASLMQLATCPNCGRKVRRLKKLTGFCETCNYRHLAIEQKKLHARLMSELRNDHGTETRAAKREYDAARRKNNRLCRDNDISLSSRRVS